MYLNNRLWLMRMDKYVFGWIQIIHKIKLKILLTNTMVQVMLMNNNIKWWKMLWRWYFLIQINQKVLLLNLLIFMNVKNMGLMEEWDFNRLKVLHWIIRKLIIFKYLRYLSRSMISIKHSNHIVIMMHWVLRMGYLILIIHSRNQSEQD